MHTVANVSIDASTGSNSTAYSSAGSQSRSSSFLEMDFDSQEEDEVNEMDLMTQFTAYKAMNVGRGTDALNFWQQNHKAFPKLASIARRVLAVQATSTIPEKNFNHSGLLMSARRTSLSEHHSEELLFLYENRSFIYFLICFFFVEVHVYD